MRIHQLLRDIRTTTEPEKKEAFKKELRSELAKINTLRVKTWSGIGDSENLTTLTIKLPDFNALYDLDEEPDWWKDWITDWENLSEALSGNTTITEIDLEDLPEVPLKQLISKINNNKNILSLCLSHCGITKEIAQALTPLLTRPSAITHFSINAFRLPTEIFSILEKSLLLNSTLEGLSLHHLLGGDSTASALINIIKNNSNLKSVHFSDIYDITPEMQSSLTQALEERFAESQALEIKPSMHSDSAHDRLNALLNVMERNITEARKEILKKALEQVTELNCRRIARTDSRLSLLFDSLKTNKTIKVLNLSDMNLSQNAIKTLCDLLSENESIHTLDLANNDIGSQGLETLIPLLEKNNTLTNLTLENAHLNMNPELTKRFIHALHNNKKLLDFYSSENSLNRNFMDPESIQLFVDYLKDSKTLLGFQLPPYLLDTALKEEIESYLDRNDDIRKEIEAHNKQIAITLSKIMPQYLPATIAALVNDYLGVPTNLAQVHAETAQKSAENAQKFSDTADQLAKKARKAASDIAPLVATEETNRKLSAKNKAEQAAIKATESAQKASQAAAKALQATEITETANNLQREKSSQTKIQDTPVDAPVDTPVTAPPSSEAPPPVEEVSQAMPLQQQQVQPLEKREEEPREAQEVPPLESHAQKPPSKAQEEQSEVQEEQNQTKAELPHQTPVENSEASIASTQALPPTPPSSSQKNTLQITAGTCLVLAIIAAPLLFILTTPLVGGLVLAALLTASVVTFASSLGRTENGEHNPAAQPAVSVEPHQKAPIQKPTSQKIQSKAQLSPGSTEPDRTSERNNRKLSR